MTSIRQSLAACAVVSIGLMTSCGGGSEVGSDQLCIAVADFTRERDEAAALRKERPEDSEAINAGVVRAFDRVVEASPADIRADAEVMLRDIRATLAARPAESDIDELIAAAKRVNAYVNSRCQASI